MIFKALHQSLKMYIGVHLTAQKANIRELWAAGTALLVIHSFKNQKGMIATR